MNKTNITWADLTWNPITGCTRGCEYCYAQKRASFGGRNEHDGHWRQTARAHSPLYEAAENDRWPVGFTPTLYPHRLDEPLRRKKPSVIFLGSMGDLFDPAFPDEFRDSVFATVAAAPRHTFMVLTKRPEEMQRYFLNEDDRATVAMEFYLDDLADEYDIPSEHSWPFSNLWLGVTVTNQADADERIPLLLSTPAAKRFVSVEPMLGPVDLQFAGQSEIGLHVMRLGLDLVIAGAKTPGKPLHQQPRRGPDPDDLPGLWLRSLRDQCEAAGVPFHYKHGGTNPALDGVVYDARPEASND